MGLGRMQACLFFLNKYAGNQFTFYSIDLPFHGQTEWKGGLTFDIADLRQIVEEILDQNSLRLQPLNGKPTLLGFSLGGRMALSLYEAIPEKLKN